MAKKIRLIDDEEQEVANASAGELSNGQVDQLMKYAEAIDWKLWEILKILRSQTEGK
jgi:hypothetical protein